MERLTFAVSSRYAGCRLDKYLSERFPFRSRTWWRQAVRDGAVGLHERACRPAATVREGDVCLVDPRLFEGHRQLLTPKDVPLLYEDEDVVVVDKPAGLVVHPLNTLTHGALTCLLRERLGGEIHLVHRLDRLTSGLMVVARSREASVPLDLQFRQAGVHKTYQALVDGCVAWDETSLDVDMGPEEGSHVRLRMGVVARGRGRRSVTSFRVLERWPTATLVEARPATGRTHQIRVHLAHLGHPVANDKLYGPVVDLDYFDRGLANLSPFYPDWHGLHAAALTVLHPRTGKPLTARAEPSGAMGAMIERLRGEGAP